LFHDAGFLCHTGFRGAFAHIFPVFAFWELGALESTAQPYRCAQLLLRSEGGKGQACRLAWVGRYDVNRLDDFGAPSLDGFYSDRVREGGGFFAFFSRATAGGSPLTLKHRSGWPTLCDFVLCKGWGF